MKHLLLTAWVSSRKSVLQILATTVLVGIVVLMIGLLARSHGVGFADLSRDPLSVVSGPPYAGALSNTFVLAWWTAAVCCFLAASILAGRGDTSRARFLTVSGLITAWLTLDDFFQFHEVIVPVHIGWPEAVIHIVYILGMLLYIAAWRRLILRTQYLILGAAAAAFALSSLIDEVIVRHIGKIPLEHLLEDGAKFVGIALWLMYFWRTSLQWTVKPVAEAQPEPSAKAATERSRAFSGFPAARPRSRPAPLRP